MRVLVGSPPIRVPCPRVFKKQGPKENAGTQLFENPIETTGTLLADNAVTAFSPHQLGYGGNQSF